MKTEDILAFLLVQTPRWIQEQRSAHRPDAADLAPFFQPGTLDRVRLKRVPAIQDPAFFSELEFAPLDFKQMAGITYDDTVLISEAHSSWPPSPSLAFHELVHVVQYGVLGVEKFATEYVMGWAQNGMDYFKIPLEVQAYDLQGQFDGGVLPEGPIEPAIAASLGR